MDSNNQSGLVAVIRLNFTTPLLNPLDIKGMTKAPCNTMTYILNDIHG